MSVFSPSGVAPLSSVSLQGSQTPTVYNVVVAVANIEESYFLPANTKRFVIQARTVATLKVAYNVGESSTNYITVGAGASYRETDLSLTAGLFLFFQTSQPNTVVEIVSWA